MIPERRSGYGYTAKTKGKHKNGKKAHHSPASDNGALDDGTRPPMTAKEFERELLPLQVELVKLQEWVKAHWGQGLRALRGA